jgi:hypothetical protein
VACVVVPRVWPATGAVLNLGLGSPSAMAC